MATTGVWRHSTRDAVLVACAIVHGVILLTGPPMPVLAFGLWWGANTVSHNFIHLPFFQERRANAAFSLYLTLVLGVPQTMWRARHLAHHAEDGRRLHGRGAPRLRWTPAMTRECGVLAGLWIALALAATGYFLTTYLPGLAAGLLLCFLQGHYEHARGTTSHYGRLYNVLFFNDGYHVEHHQTPGLHWTRLPAQPRLDRSSSAWPPVLRWLEGWRAWPAALNVLERMVFRVGWLQRLVLGAHRRAMRSALASVGSVSRVTIVGGGLFPRSALILRELLPAADITVLDASPAHLARARPLLDRTIRTAHATFRGAADACDADVVVIPLAYLGDRESVYRHPPARVVLVHDWLWRPRGRTITVSTFLLKRLNVIVTPAI